MSQRETAQLPLVWRVFKIIGDIIWDMRAPLLVSVGAFIVFYVPGQTREIYRVLALEVETAPYRPIISLILLAGLSYFLWSMSRSLWKNSVDIDPHVTFSPLARFISHVFSMLIALLPIIGVLMAMMPSGVGSTVELIAEVGIPGAEDRETVGGQFAVVSRDIVQSLRGQNDFPPYISEIVDNYNQVAVYLLIAIQATAALLLVMFLFLLWRAFRPGSHFAKQPFSLWYFVPIVLALGAIIALVAAQPIIRSLGGGPLLVTWIITGVGSFAIICLFLMALTYLLAGCTRIYDVIGIPAVTILVSAALIFAFFNWNNNHKVRLQPANPEAEAQPDDLYIAFLDWLDNRPDDRKRLYADIGNQKYPVYVVAAQGGGVYAANLAALTMARLYTACPALRHHVFAISGVSGGSLGASAFNAFWMQARRNQSPEVMGDHCQLQAKTDGRISALEQNIRTYLGHDFLSPVLSGALFPDFFQRFIVPGFGVLDRARAFEASLNHAWIDTNRKLGNETADNAPTPFERNFLRASADFRDPQVQAPSLVLNTTSVETGERFVVAPFLKDPIVPMEFVYPIMAQGDDGMPAEHDISLATAVSLSARFPIILPPGAYPRQISPFHFSQKNLVDGGYFESSAIETAIDLVNGIKQRLQRLSDTLDVQPEFRIIILNEDFTADLEPAGLTEFGAPVMTLDKTRRRRGQLAKWRVKTGEAFERFYAVELQHDYFYMPLGWHLSKTTQNMIAEQIGFPSECRIPAYTPDSETAAIFGRSPSFRNFIQLVNELNNNRCSLADIITELPPARAQAAVAE
ncbi:hypothetical protein [Dichotomicrobium thermohalophilum]|uniref:Patatin-like phospholipase n=1 Tax=Dichotomicrobium thermohalophilum TaxID=933063 RepID=A0A397Q2K3_9HYPH|nr:hypothetical protein [Dichotomicrobium thermohalophilum]RIA55288.1 hypothetical protein BXY53_0349 [Dichotomicrobium thermohalophilum]